MGTALPNGLYDPALGPYESKASAPCITCGNLYINCPGHSGHIELCVPVYQPLLFPDLVKLLRIKCLACHSFRISQHEALVFQVKLALLDTGRWKEALELENELTSLSKRVSLGIQEEGGSSSEPVTRQGREELKTQLIKSKFDLLKSKLISIHQSKTQNVTLNSHERSERRKIVKEFFKLCGTKKKCANCGAFSPKLRQDASNKIFQCPLSSKNKSLNRAENVTIKSASVGFMHGAGDSVDEWASDDSDIEDDSDADLFVGEPEGESTMTDEEEDGKDLFRNKGRESTVKTRTKATSAQSKAAEATVRPDKFMHAFEIEEQVKATWRKDPLLCSQVFGCAHSSSQSDDMDQEGYDGSSFFFMRVIAVPPSRFRPPMVMGTMTVEHAQNHYLNKILELNDRLRILLATVQKLEAGVGSVDEDKPTKDEMENIQARSLSTWIDLQTTVNCFIDSSKDPSAAAANKVPNGIRQLLEKKEGIFRK